MCSPPSRTGCQHHYQAHVYDGAVDPERCGQLDFFVTGDAPRATAAWFIGQVSELQQRREPLQR
jgi:hypothetical protein